MANNRTLAQKKAMADKRVFVMFYVFFIVFALLLTRVIIIQLFSGRNLVNSAALQRQTDVLIDRPRGNILDRNGIPFTNRTQESAIIIEPYVMKTKQAEMDKVREILDLDPYVIKREIELGKGPFVVTTDKNKRKAIMGLGVEGISAVNYLVRYNNNTLAKHILGYLNTVDGFGESGLDKYYEDALKVKGVSRVVITTDAMHNRLEGQEIRVIIPEKVEERLNVKLTIDYNIQKIVEEVMSNYKITGAVVVENVCTGEIVAMASKPDFDQNDISKFLNNEQEALFNRAVAAYNPGSVFKIIDTAYLLENNLYIDEEYLCTGSINLNGNIIKCSSYSTGGHGLIGLNDAFAKSCNSYFINAIIKNKGPKLVELSKKFGLGSPTGIDKQGVAEASGEILDYSLFYNDGDYANFAIGQKGVMTTPVQIADLVATIANGGIKNNLIIVDSILNQDGDKVRNVGIKKGTRIISKTTADKLKELMEDATKKDGTGFCANLDRLGGTAGKTGSAETSKYIDGEKVVNAWFAGYFPRNNPKYSIAVFVENGKSGSSSAAPIFADIAEIIMSKGL